MAFDFTKLNQPRVSKNKDLYDRIATFLTDNTVNERIAKLTKIYEQDCDSQTYSIDGDTYLRRVVEQNANTIEHETMLDALADLIGTDSRNAALFGDERDHEYLDLVLREVEADLDRIATDEHYASLCVHASVTALRTKSWDDAKRVRAMVVLAVALGA